MLAGEFLIFIIVLINYFVKKDIYLSTLLGMVLTGIYFVVLGNIPLDIIFYKTSIVIFLRVFVFFIFILSFHYLYNALNEYGIKGDLIRIFNVFFEDKKTKILFLLLSSVIFYKLPLVAIILLVFLSIILSFNLITAVVMPFILVTFLTMVSSYINVFLIQEGKILYIQIIVLFYILMFLVITFERIMKNYKISIYNFIVDFAYYLVFLVLNIAIFLFLDYLYSPFGALISSMIIITFIMIGTLRRYPFLIVKDIEEENPVSDIFLNLKLPYITFFSIFLLYLCLFLICSFNLILGLICFVVVNLFISKKILPTKTDYKVLFILKLISILVISSILLILIKYENININHLFDKLSDFYLLKVSDIKNVLFISSNFSFIPNFNMDLNSLVSALEYNEIWKVKVYLLVKIQLILSFVNIFILSFIFNLKKKDIFYVSLVLIASSLIFQMILYIY